MQKEPNDALSSEWRAFWRDEWILYSLLLAFAPFVMVLALIEGQFPGGVVRVVLIILFVSWSGALIAFLLRYASFRCPRCGDCFFGTSGWRGFSYKDWGRCRHCGLRKWASPNT